MSLREEEQAALTTIDFHFLCETCNAGGGNPRPADYAIITTSRRSLLAAPKGQASDRGSRGRADPTKVRYHRRLR